MTLIEKLEALTPEQQQRLDAVATEQELDAFLRETGAGLTDEEKNAAWKYIQAGQAKPDGDLAGKTELADEELENVAGGGCGSSLTPDEQWERAAKKDKLYVYVPLPCPICNAQSNGKYSLHAHKHEVRTVPAGTVTTWYDAACMNCKKRYHYVEKNPLGTIQFI